MSRKLTGGEASCRFFVQGLISNVPFSGQNRAKSAQARHVAFRVAPHARQQDCRSPANFALNGNNKSSISAALESVERSFVSRSMFCVKQALCDAPTIPNLRGPESPN
jgi:hypothetical protein